MAFDPRAGGKLWGFIVFLPAMLLAFLGFLGLLVWSYLGIGFVRHRAVGCRLWGRMVLAVFGIRLEIVGGEHLRTDGPLIITFNHQSLLDLALLAALWPTRGSVIYKQEFHDIPIMGRLMRRLGMIPVDRENRERALASLDLAAERVAREGVQLFVAPEGTRSRLGRLAKFKRGPFHLAAKTHAPLVPVVFQGVDVIMPFDALVPRTGRVRAEVMPPIDTSDWTPSDVARRSVELRRVYRAALGETPQEEPAAALS